MNLTTLQFTEQFESEQPYMEVSEDYVEDELDDSISKLCPDLVFEIITENSFIGLQSGSGTIEMFYVLQVESKGIAESYISFSLSTYL